MKPKVKEQELVHHVLEIRLLLPLPLLSLGFVHEVHEVQPLLLLTPVQHRLPGHGFKIAVMGSGTDTPERISLERGSRSLMRRGPPRRRQKVWRWCATRQTLRVGGGGNWAVR